MLYLTQTEHSLLLSVIDGLYRLQQEEPDPYMDRLYLLALEAELRRIAHYPKSVINLEDV